MKSGYCTIMWNGRNHRASKMNHHQPHQRVVSQESDEYMVELERSRLLWAHNGKPDNSNKSCSHLDQLKAITQNCPELVKRKHIIFDQENIRLHVFLMTRQNPLTTWLESSDWSTLFTRHRDFRCPIHFRLYKVLLREKNEKIPRKTVKGTWNSSLLKKIKFWESGIMKLPEKMAEGSGTK